jgi:uncharacterized membrane protein YhhN
LRADYAGPPWQVYTFKLLTILLVVVSVAIVRKPASGRYKLLILVGLILSMAGDMLLALPSNLFVAGLLSFLLAQIVYIFAFRTGLSVPLGRKAAVSTVPFVLYGILMYAILWPGLGPLAVPVLAYLVVILGMAWMAYQRRRLSGTKGALLAFVGALLFVVSDSVLALNRFGTGFAAAAAITWITYVSAQWLIGQSVRADSDP